MTLPAGFRSLRHHNFRLFFTGQLVSLIGTWMQQVGQAWLVLQLTNDPFALGLVAAAQFTPVIVLGLFAGVLADALPKRRTLMATQTAAGLLALALGLLVIGGHVQVWHVYVMAALLGVVNALDMPVRQSFVAEMVPREDIGNAVALNSAVFNGTRIVGPAIAGLLIGPLGIGVCFLVNAASYGAVIVSLVGMRPAELRAAVPSTLKRNVRSIVDQLTEGLRYVRDEPTVRLSLTVLGLVATAALNFQVLLPILARDVLHGDAGTYGFLMAATGVGSFSSAIMIAFGQRPTPRLLLLGAGAIGLGMLGLSLSTWLPLSLLVMLVVGWGVIAMAATTNTLIQLTTPDALRGRVMSVYTTVFAGSTPVGGLFAGSLAAIAGAPIALAAGGAVALATVGYAFWRLPGGRSQTFDHHRMSTAPPPAASPPSASSVANGRRP